MAQKLQKYAAGSKNQGSSEAVVEDPQFMGQRFETEDPVAKFIAANYNRILLVVAIGLAAWFGTGYYEQQNLNVSKAGGEVLASTQVALEDLINTPADSKDKEQIKTRETALRSLEGGVQSLSQTVEPYPLIATYYGTIAKIETGKLKAKDVKFIFETGYAQNDQRFLQEVQDLTVSKYLLDEDLKAGKMALKSIAEKANFVAAAAATTLARLADSKEERKEALVLIEALSKRQPEVASQFEQIKPILQN